MTGHDRLKEAFLVLPLADEDRWVMEDRITRFSDGEAAMMAEFIYMCLHLASEMRIPLNILLER